MLWGTRLMRRLANSNLSESDILSSQCCLHIQCIMGYLRQLMWFAISTKFCTHGGHTYCIISTKYPQPTCRACPLKHSTITSLWKKPHTMQQRFFIQTFTKVHFHSKVNTNFLYEYTCKYTYKMTTRTVFKGGWEPKT